MKQPTCVVFTITTPVPQIRNPGYWAIKVTLPVSENLQSPAWKAKAEGCQVPTIEKTRYFEVSLTYTDSR